MNADATPWSKWSPPYDPRLCEGSDVYQDEHGRMIETALCGIRCPGCGICCAGYRDEVSWDYRGAEEFELNLGSMMVPGRLVKQEGGSYYRGVDCGQDCPGFGRCCPPFDQRDRPKNVADARSVLLERQDSMCWEMQEALLVLAHDGSDEAVEILEAYFPRAHTRLEGFAEYALDEGRFFNEIPKNEFEREQMTKRDLLDAYEERLYDAQAEIDEEVQPELERLRYELAIFERLCDKDEDQQARGDWDIQIDVQKMIIGQQEDHLAELQADLQRYEAIIAEIETDLGKSEAESTN